MIAYKGFAPGMVCRDYQFVMGLNVTDKANCAANGFHCAANPLDCLSYYSDMDRSEYYIVNAGGDLDEDSVDSKIACTELTILKRLDRKNFLLHALLYMVNHPKTRWNHHVQRDFGESSQGFAIVRGVNPLAKGHLGDYLAYAKESEDGNQIVQVALTIVDGETVMPNVWYDVDFKPSDEPMRKRRST